MNKKVRKAALKSVLTQKLDEGRLKIVDRIELPEIRTSEMAKLLDGLGVQSVLIVIPERDEIIEKSARNIPGVKVVEVKGINVYDLLRYEDVLVTEACIPHIEQKVS